MPELWVVLMIQLAGKSDLVSPLVCFNIHKSYCPKLFGLSQLDLYSIRNRTFVLVTEMLVLEKFKLEPYLVVLAHQLNLMQGQQPIVCLLISVAFRLYRHSTQDFISPQDFNRQSSADFGGKVTASRGV